MKTAEKNTISKSVVDRLRSDFPILSRTINNKPLIYFDNAATTQKPKQVIEAIRNYYEQDNANIHRGVHGLSQYITIEYENARSTVQMHINAQHAHEIIFTSGTTESINLVAHSFGKMFIKEGDEVLVTEMEHHSNILPWQVVCEEKGAFLKVAPINDKGELIIDEFKKLLTDKTKLVSLTHVSNALGTVNPVKELIALSHSKNIPVLIDGAQAVPHMEVDVQELDADFYVFSGHKMYAPTGVGILYGKEKLLNVMSPYKVGGGTIKTVSFDKTVYADLPLKFEAGTPNIEGGIGLAAALYYMNAIGIETIHQFENELLQYATEQISALKQVKLVGTANEKASVLSFNVDGAHPFDVGVLLDKQGIAVRTGHHCTQPLMERLGIQGTVRASFSFYNTKEEIDVFIEALKKSIKMLL